MAIDLVSGFPNEHLLPLVFVVPRSLPDKEDIGIGWPRGADAVVLTGA